MIDGKNGSGVHIKVEKVIALVIFLNTIVVINHALEPNPVGNAAVVTVSKILTPECEPAGHGSLATGIEGLNTVIELEQGPLGDVFRTVHVTAYAEIPGRY